MPPGGKMTLSGIMASAVMWKRSWLVIFGIALGSLLFYSFSHLNFTDKLLGQRLQPHNDKYSVWPQLQLQSPVDSKFFSSNCALSGTYSITGLTDIKTQWSKTRNTLCQSLYDKFTYIFTLDARKATLKIPDPFKPKVFKWLANKQELYNEVFNQDVIHVISEYTREHTMFNPLRDKRPVLPPDVPESTYFQEMMNSTSGNCDFCKFKQFTAEHLFGRVESTHAFSASNIFKIDTLHALLALKKHDPIHWSLEEFLDLFSLTEHWLNKAHDNFPKAHYPSLVWDILPKCGASQVHPHMHVVFDFERYHGEVEAWRKGAQEYFIDHNSNYFSDLVAIYSALNLTVTYGDAVAFASLVPRKDHEIVVIAEKPSTDFYTLLYFVLRAFIDDLHKMCFSLGVGLPAVGVPEGKMPAYARTITRGYVSDIRADISSLELFMATNVNIDPYKTIEIIRRSIKNHIYEPKPSQQETLTLVHKYK